MFWKIYLDGIRIKFESWKVRIHTQIASQSHFYCFLRDIWILKSGYSPKSPTYGIMCQVSCKEKCCTHKNRQKKHTQKAALSNKHTAYFGFPAEMFWNIYTNEKPALVTLWQLMICFRGCLSTDRSVTLWTVRTKLHQMHKNCMQWSPVCSHALQCIAEHCQSQSWKTSKPSYGTLLQTL